MNDELTDDNILRMRIAAANDQLVQYQLQDIADGYPIPNKCTCGWESLATRKHDRGWSGTWCLHCTANEMTNTTNDPDQL